MVESIINAHCLIDSIDDTTNLVAFDRNLGKVSYGGIKDAVPWFQSSSHQRLSCEALVSPTCASATQHWSLIFCETINNMPNMY